MLAAVFCIFVTASVIRACVVAHDEEVASLRDAQAAHDQRVALEAAAMISNVLVHLDGISHGKEYPADEVARMREDLRRLQEDAAVRFADF